MKTDLPTGFPLPDWVAPDIPERKVMRGKFCRLEPLDAAAHATGLWASLSEDELGRSWTYLPAGPFGSFEDFSNWLAYAAAGTDLQFYAITLNETAKPAGVACYLRIQPEIGSIEVGHILFSPVLQRTAAATEAMFLMMQHAFQLGYRRYEWKCDALNAASCRAAERFGFSFEGIFRQATIYKNRNRDTAWFSIIDREWPELEAAFQQWLSPENFDETGTQIIPLRDLTGPLLKSRRTN